VFKWDGYAILNMIFFNEMIKVINVITSIQCVLITLETVQHVISWGVALPAIRPK
jgi:hypothetical protein